MVKSILSAGWVDPFQMTNELLSTPEGLERAREVIEETLIDKGVEGKRIAALKTLDKGIVPKIVPGGQSIWSRWAVSATVTETLSKERVEDVHNVVDLFQNLTVKELKTSMSNIYKGESPFNHFVKLMFNGINGVHTSDVPRERIQSFLWATGTSNPKTSENRLEFTVYFDEASRTITTTPNPGTTTALATFDANFSTASGLSSAATRSLLLYYAGRIELTEVVDQVLQSINRGINTKPKAFLKKAPDFGRYLAGEVPFRYVDQRSIVTTYQGEYGINFEQKLRAIKIPEERDKALEILFEYLRGERAND